MAGSQKSSFRQNNNLKTLEEKDIEETSPTVSISQNINQDKLKNIKLLQTKKQSS